GEHGVVLGEEHAAAAGLVVVGCGVEQLEQRGLFGVIRAGRVAGSGADADVLLADQRLVVQRLVAGVAPVLLAHPSLPPLALGLVGLGQFVGTDAGGGDEAADVVGLAAFLRRDEVGQ